MENAEMLYYNIQTEINEVFKYCLENLGRGVQTWLIFYYRFQCSM